MSTTTTRTPARPAANPAVRAGAQRETLQPFASLGEQLIAVKRAAEDGIVDPRLHRLAGASGLQQGVASDGGFMVQPDQADFILDRAWHDGQLLRRTFRYPIKGDGTSGARIPAFDETSRADGQRAGGVQVFWVDEATTVTAAKPKLRAIEANPRKLMGLLYLTNEFNTDMPGFSELALGAFSREITFMVEDAMVNGRNGVLGILNSKSMITVLKEINQGPKTFTWENAVKLFARAYRPSAPDSVVWLVSQDAFPALLTMSTGSSSGVFQPYVAAIAGDVDAPYGRLLGRAVVPSEHNASLGTLGDIVLTDLGQYLIADRPAKQLASLHVKFLTDEACFRVTYRVAGVPMWTQPVTPKNGTETISPIVALESR